MNEINGDTDYCDDTMPYERYTEDWYDENGNDANNRLKITENGVLFYSTNIMDDQSFRSSITMDQMKLSRITARSVGLGRASGHSREKKINNSLVCCELREGGS